MITPTARLRPVIGALLALAIIIFGAPWTTSQEVSAQAQEVFVSVMDASGEPVTDLTAEELLIQWDGMDCETLNLETLNWPVRLTIFVDNADGAQGRMNPSAAATAQQNARVALQNMREGLKLFLDEIPEEVEVGMATLAGRARFLTRNPRYTTDREALARAIDLMIPDAAAARFRDSLVEEAEALNDEAERQYFPVIVMLSNDGAEGSTSQQNAFERGFQRLIANQATIHTRLFTAGTPAVGHGHEPRKCDGRHLRRARRQHRVPHHAAGAGPGHRPQAPSGEHPVSSDLRPAGWRIRPAGHGNPVESSGCHHDPDDGRERAVRTEDSPRSEVDVWRLP